MSRYCVTRNERALTDMVERIYAIVRELECKGWSYRPQHSSRYMYNETLRDLLGRLGNTEKIINSSRSVTMMRVNVVNVGSPDELCLKEPWEIEVLLARSKSMPNPLIPASFTSCLASFNIVSASFDVMP
jgi:hypothetical protein